MISKEEFERLGIKAEDEVGPLDILEKTNMAMNTHEMAQALTKTLPEGEITYACAKQKLVRLEKKGLVKRSKVKGLNYWLKA
jgi:hypothetical protein